MHSTELARGIRCTRCGAEVSHVVTDDIVDDATKSAEERVYGTEHRKACGGTLVRFTAERHATHVEINAAAMDHHVIPSA